MSAGGDVAAVVEGLLAERRAREARLREMADRLLGKPPVVMVPDAPEPPPVRAAAEAPPVRAHGGRPSETAETVVPTFQAPPVRAEAAPPARAEPHEPAEADRLRAERDELLERLRAGESQMARLAAEVADAGAPFREAVARLTSERDELLRKNEALYTEMAEAAKAAQADPAAPVQPDPVVLAAEREAADRAHAELAQSRAGLAVAGAEIASLRDALASERSALAQERSALADARSALAAARIRLEELSRRPAEDPAQAARLKEALEARARLEVSHRTAEVRIGALEKALADRERGWAEERRRLEAAAAHPQTGGGGTGPSGKVPEELARRLREARGDWLGSVLRELSRGSPPRAPDASGRA